MLCACLYTICFVFSYTSWHFYAFSRTNLLMRCHSASSLFSIIFMFQKSYTGNMGARGQPHPRVARPRPWPRHQGVRPPGPPLDAALPPIYYPRWEKHKGPINFPQNILQPAAVIDARSGESRSSSWHPVGLSERGIPARGLLHHHGHLHSDVWVVYLRLRVIAEARWSSHPPCASYLDLVSCLSWSRSSLCNSTYCVCWDSMSIGTMSSWCAELLSLSYLYVVYDLACSPLLVAILAE
jgi:hypothetical protein